MAAVGGIPELETPVGVLEAWVVVPAPRPLSEGELVELDAWMELCGVLGDPPICAWTVAVSGPEEPASEAAAPDLESRRWIDVAGEEDTMLS